MLVTNSQHHRRQQISLHGKVGEARKDISAIASSLTKSIGSSTNTVKLALEDWTVATGTKIDNAADSIRTTILDTSVPVLQALQSAATSNERSLSDLKTIVSEHSLRTAVQLTSMGTNVSVQAGTHESNATSRHSEMRSDLARFSEQNESAFRSVEQHMQCNNAQQLMITNIRDQFQIAVEARLEAIQATMTKMTEVNINEEADGSFVVSGLNLGEIELPLLLAKSHLVNAIPVSNRMENVRLSWDELSWLSQELDSLKDQATAFSYHSARRSTPNTTSRTEFHAKSPGEPVRSLAEPGDRMPAHGAFISQTTHYLETSVGTIFLLFRHKGLIDPSGQVSHIQKVCFTFMPRLEICGTGFAAIIHRSESQLPLYREICVYNILPYDHEIFGAVLENDWKALEQMLRQDQTLLHVLTEHGYSPAAVSNIYRKKPSKSDGSSVLCVLAVPSHLRQL